MPDVGSLVLISLTMGTPKPWLTWTSDVSVERVSGPPFPWQLFPLETEDWQQIAHLTDTITAFWTKIVIQRKYITFWTLSEEEYGFYGFY